MSIRHGRAGGIHSWGAHVAAQIECTGEAFGYRQIVNKPASESVDGMPVMRREVDEKRHEKELNSNSILRQYAWITIYSGIF